MRCPVCGRWVEDNDWAGSMCVCCALKQAKKQNKKQEDD